MNDPDDIQFVNKRYFLASVWHTGGFHFCSVDTDKIEVRGARTHNLKNINLTLPREQLIVITGLSGSGKSSLAFDTLYAEGQRRYVESLSAYARQFLSMMERERSNSKNFLNSPSWHQAMGSLLKTLMETIQ